MFCRFWHSMCVMSPSAGTGAGGLMWKSVCRMRITGLTVCDKTIGKNVHENKKVTQILCLGGSELTD
jgi:hypothetical protein